MCLRQFFLAAVAVASLYFCRAGCLGACITLPVFVVPLPHFHCEETTMFWEFLLAFTTWLELAAPVHTPFALPLQMVRPSCVLPLPRAEFPFVFVLLALSFALAFLQAVAAMQV